MRRFSHFAAAFLCLLVVRCGLAQEPSFRVILSKLAPRSPEKSLAALRVRDGFRVELMCAEPLVSDPIAIDWGADGKLWVVEMGDYPTGSESGGGRIRYLEDRDHDGRLDRSTVFLEGLNFPTGVMAWRKGVLVTCAPEIFYAEDTTGDGRADHREVLFSGFGQGNPQHRVNGLRWGLDNWIYGANGDSGGLITSTATGQQMDIHARDFRIRPDAGVIETQTGMSQFGRCRDDWGNWFGGRNLEPIWHCALEDHYLRRNPYLVPPDPCVDLMDPPTCARVFPISTTLPRFNEPWTFNRFTSSCGIAIYRDNLFGPGFSHSCFICEPTHNLVHHEMLYRKGVTYGSRKPPGQAKSEFLASSDHWFRPTQVRTGPDGALWVVDMYRLVIEHPEYIPAKWHSELDFHAGSGMGRIYRVLPIEGHPRTFRSLEELSTRELVCRIDNANGIQRDLVQQTLVHRGDRSAVEPLRSTVAKSTRAVSRLSALCTLDGLGAADTATLQLAMRDPHPAVRRHAIRISESRLNGTPALQTAVLQRVKDPDPQVRMQLAYSLGEWNDPRAGRALARVAIRDADDPLLMASVMSSATRYPGVMLEQILDHGRPTAPQAALIENLLRLVLESQRDDVLALGLKRIGTAPGGQFATWQYRVVAGLLDALGYQAASLRDLRREASTDLAAAIDSMTGIFRAARTAAMDAEAPIERRLQAVRLLGRGLDAGPDDASRLAGLLVPQVRPELQRAAVDALDRMEPSGLPDMLLADWPQHGPQLRSQILNVLVRRKAWTLALLDRIENGQVAANELGATIHNKLILHTFAQVRQRANALLDPSTPEELQTVIERFRHQLSQPGDAENGRAVFRQHCSTCHRLNGEGTEIGPDLLALTDRSPETLLVSILDPNRAVAPRFVEYMAMTLKGRVIAGIVASETGNSITLIDSQGAKHQLLRVDLDELTSAGKSLMPVGVEKLFAKPADLLDVIAYLRQPPDAAEVVSK